MSIRNTIKIDKNIYHITAHYSVDIFFSLAIDGVCQHYFSMIESMFPKKTMELSEQAIKLKHIAYADPILEFKYINFIYKKNVLSMKYIKEIHSAAIRL